MQTVPDQTTLLIKMLGEEKCWAVVVVHCIVLLSCLSNVLSFLFPFSDWLKQHKSNQGFHFQINLTSFFTTPDTRAGRSHTSDHKSQQKVGKLMRHSSGFTYFSTRRLSLHQRNSRGNTFHLFRVGNFCNFKVFVLKILTCNYSFHSHKFKIAVFFSTGGEASKFPFALNTLDKTFHGFTSRSRNKLFMIDLFLFINFSLSIQRCTWLLTEWGRNFLETSSARNNLPDTRNMTPQCNPDDEWMSSRSIQPARYPQNMNEH